MTTDDVFAELDQLAPGDSQSAVDLYRRATRGWP